MEWIKEIDFIYKINLSGKKYRFEGVGRNPSTLNIEDDFLKWILEQRYLKIVISTNEIIAKLLEMEPHKKANSFHSLKAWYYRF